jgi:hypothetical protein
LPQAPRLHLHPQRHHLHRLCRCRPAATVWVVPPLSWQTLMLCCQWPRSTGRLGRPRLDAARPVARPERCRPGASKTLHRQWLDRHAARQGRQRVQDRGTAGCSAWTQIDRGSIRRRGRLLSLAHGRGSAGGRFGALLAGVGCALTRIGQWSTQSTAGRRQSC